MDELRLLDLMQVTDRSFPTGAYVHSGGLEWLLGHPELLDLEGALRVRLYQQLARFELVFLLAAYERPPDMLDRRLQAMCLPRETREASSLVGRALLRQAADLFDVPSIRDFREHAPFAHHPIVFGVVSSSLGIDSKTAAAAYAFQVLRGQVSVAQRVARLGQSEAQRLLHGMKRDVLDAVCVAGALSIDEVAPFMPILDIAAMAHERSPVRLFVS
jgi:urease accessory protein